jgi:hypothetical protein
MEDGSEIIWTPLERAEALRILQEQAEAGDAWLLMADALSPGVASSVAEFVFSRESFRANNQDLRTLIENNSATDRETDKNTGDRMNDLEWMVSSLKTWDDRWPPEAKELKKAFWEKTTELKTLIWKDQAVVRSGMQNSTTTTTATAV